MKTCNIHLFLRALTLVLFLTWSSAVSAKELTAFDLIKEGNRYIGEHAKDKVVQIRSEKSVGGLTPTIWYVVYYDSTATMKAVQVKFGAGKMMDVKRPLRLLEPITGGGDPLDRTKLKIDSDKAQKIALDEPLLENLTVKASAMKLEEYEGDVVWRVKLWVSKLTNPDKTVEIGEVFLLAETGKVIKADLKISKAG